MIRFISSYKVLAAVFPHQIGSNEKWSQYNSNSRGYVAKR